LTVITENADPSLVTQGLVGDKPYLVTVDIGAYVTVARPYIAPEWPERQPKQCLTLHAVSGEALLIMREVFLTLNFGRCPIKIWVLFADITNEFILGLDLLQNCNVYVDRERQTLRLVEEEVSIWIPRAGPRPSSMVFAKNQVTPARCKGIIIARLVSPSEYKAV
jgi:hypothetical protein